MQVARKAKRADIFKRAEKFAKEYQDKERDEKKEKEREEKKKDNGRERRSSFGYVTDFQQHETKSSLGSFRIETHEGMSYS